MSVKKIILVLLALLLVGGFIAVGITDAVKTKDQIEFQKLELNSKTTEIKELNVKYNKLNDDLEKASKDKETNQAELDRLNKEKEELNKQKQDLESKLQAKLQREESAKVASAVTTVASSGSVESVIIQASAKYGVDANMMLRIAKCESTMNPYARNPSPVIVKGVNYGHAEGLFQFIPSTWTRMSSQAGYAGASVTDVHANANVAAWAFSTGHKGEWECKT